MPQNPYARSRTLIVAFEGWNDAGDAASGAVRRLRDLLDLDVIHEADPEVYVDYQFSRPVVAIDDDGARRIVWPGITMFGPIDPLVLPRVADATDPSAPRVVGENADNLYLLLGTEPSRSWKTFAREIVETAIAHEIEFVILLGALLADVPHSRPISVFGTSGSRDVRRAYGVERSTYEGPTGIVGVLAEAFEREGVATMSVWASVPHYVHNAPSPKATLALIDRLEEVLDVVVPRGELIGEAAEWESGIDALADDDDDMAGYIQSLERARDAVESPEASGDAIAEEFERYLRRGDGRGEPGVAGDDPRRP